MKFEKGRGLTASEQILAEICERSFLHLWTYPNLYTKPNKELSDLMVVFGNDIILFSDKSCAYPNRGSADLDWKSWYRRSIAASAHQNQQAERSIRLQPDHVFLDVKATVPLPVALPEMSHARFHHVCVVTGANERCYTATGRLSLTLNLSIIDDAVPFTVGRIPKAKAFVHVLDSIVLQLLLRELNTASDFIGYLQAKERFVAEGHLEVAVEESDLLAIFLANGHRFPDDVEHLQPLPGYWRQFSAAPQYVEGRRRDRIRLW